VANPDLFSFLLHLQAKRMTSHVSATVLLAVTAEIHCILLRHCPLLQFQSTPPHEVGYTNRLNPEAYTKRRRRRRTPMLPAAANLLLFDQQCDVGRRAAAARSVDRRQLSTRRMRPRPRALIPSAWLASRPNPNRRTQSGVERLPAETERP